MVSKNNGRRKFLAFDVDTKGRQESNEGLNARKTRITNIGVKTSEFEKPISYANERKILTEFWDLVREGDYTLVGFNCKRFDIPFLYIRSLIHQIPTVPLDGRQLDLRMILSNENFGYKGTLKECGVLLGYKFSFSGFSKSNVQLLWQGYKIPELLDRLLEDVRIIYHIFERVQEVGLI